MKAPTPLAKMTKLTIDAARGWVGQVLRFGAMDAISEAYEHDRFLFNLGLLGIPESERRIASRLSGALAHVTPIPRGSITDAMRRVAEHGNPFLPGILAFYLQWLNQVVPRKFRHSTAARQEQWARDAGLELPWPGRARLDAK